MQTQLTMTDPQQELRQMNRDLGALQVYVFLRRPHDPEWRDLTPYQQKRFVAAFLIGASSIDMRKVLAQ